MGSMEKLRGFASDKTLLYIESDPALQRNFGVYLKKVFQEFYQAFDGGSGYELFLKVKPDVVLMDLEFEKKDPIELIVDMKEKNPQLKIITLSENNSNYTFLQSFDMQISSMMLKPISFSRIVDQLIHILPVAKPIVPVVPTVKKGLEKKEPVPQVQKAIALLVSQENSAKKTKNEQPQVVQVVQQKEKKQEELKQEEPKKEERKITPVKQTITPQNCLLDIKEFFQNGEDLILMSTYKGITIQNKAKIISVLENSFELKGSTAQLVAAKYEKHIVLHIPHKNRYIYATVMTIDLQKNQLRLANPRYIEYKRRDPNLLRLRCDGSFKSTMFFQNKHIDFQAKEVSLEYLLLVTTNKELQIEPKMQIDLTLGFEIASPSALIKEKKFTKAFAKATVIRVQKNPRFLEIAVNIEVQKSGQSSFKKYIKQRENETIEELKKIIKR